MDLSQLMIVKQEKHFNIMRTLDLNELENLTAGDFIDGVCLGLGAGTAIYAAGIATNFWNPVGWISGGLAIADAACVVRTYYKYS